MIRRAAQHVNWALCSLSVRRERFGEMLFQRGVSTWADMTLLSVTQSSGKAARKLVSSMPLSATARRTAG
jgi:hypothetical protein